jgi:hypothetical protein
MSARPDLFDHLEEGPMPGGCNFCDAYLTAEVPFRGVYLVHVHHDDRCPVLRSRAAGSN